jgi:phosphate transport system substrate-binding protein
LAALMSHAAVAADISGAGGTFPDSIYVQWSDAYKLQTGVVLNYLPVGSGEGIKQIEAKGVDFGASDKPLSTEDLEKNGLIQFPSVIGGVVPVVNVSGVKPGTLKLDGKTLADIYLGKITKWNDPALAALNPDTKLPNLPIAVVYRADKSGTSFIFTNYLSKVSPEWKSAVGEGTSVAWKVGTGCRSNTMMPICMSVATNAISYMNYAFAVKMKMSMVQLKNSSGKFVAPNMLAFQAAADHANWEQSSGFNEILTDEPGVGSWPITGATFILMHKVQDKADSARAVLGFFDWAYSTTGDTMASELGYVPLPDKVQQLVRGAWKTQITDTRGNAVCQASCAKG